MNTAHGGEPRYPLSWPVKQPRTKHRKRAQFREGTSNHISTTTALTRLSLELDRLDPGVDARGVVSTNIQVRVDGGLRMNERPPEDPGVAVYFTFKNRRIVLACDKWDRVADNIAAIAKHIESQRGQDRWGVGTLEQAFFGYLAIGGPGVAKDWRDYLGHSITTLAQAEEAFREKAKRLHPDAVAGDGVQMAELSNAMADAKRELQFKQ